MTLSYIDIDFNLDFLEAIPREILFLQRVDELKYLHDPNVIKESVRRYELFWLPLVIRYDGKIAAPMDIYWVWHVHMLSPLSYIHDLNNRFRKVIDHQFLDDSAYNSAIKEIQSLWESKYVSEPFNLTSLDKSYKFNTKFTYNLVDAASRQTSFLYQVSLPHFRSKRFLLQSIDRYKMFLSLKRRYPNKYLIPCYDIDIIWHTHRVHPLIYQLDCDRHLGSLFAQDDRSWNKEMILLEILTSKMWRKCFQESFTNSGSMYRGKNCKGKLVDLRERHVVSFMPRILQLEVGISSDKVEKQNLKIKAYLLSGKDELWVCTYDYRKQKSVTHNMVTFWTNKNTEFRLKLVKKVGIVKKILWNSVVRTLERFEHFFELNSNISIPCEIATKSTSDVVNLKFTLKSYVYDDLNNRVKRGDFFTVLYNRFDKHALELISLPISKKEDFEGLMASHNLITENGKQAFVIDIIHIMSLNQSIVKVLCAKNICAVAHLINPDQLPNRLQVEDFTKFPTINNSDAKCAMIIKDNKGDWMIVVPKWLETKVDKHKTKNNRSIHGFDVRIYHLRKQQECIFHKIEDSGSISFEIDNLYVNVTSGIILLKSTDQLSTIPNYICLAFVIPLLFVLCNPKLICDVEPKSKPIPDDKIKDYFEIHQQMSLDSKVKLLGIPAALKSDEKGIANTRYSECQLLLASGYLYDAFLPKCCKVGPTTLRRKHKEDTKETNIDASNIKDVDKGDIDNNIVDIENPDLENTNVLSTDVSSSSENRPGENITNESRLDINNQVQPSVPISGETNLNSKIYLSGTVDGIDGGSRRG